MADKPCELQLYKVAYRLAGRNMLYDARIAIEQKGDSGMDEATELAEEVRLLINADTGMDYQLSFLGCIGTVYIWCKV
jgi:hypothetical protein